MRLGTIVACALVVGYSSVAAAQSPVVGVWELQSIVDTASTGKVPQWMGVHPTGLIVYTATGHVTVQIMRDPRPRFPRTRHGALTAKTCCPQSPMPKSETRLLVITVTSAPTIWTLQRGPWCTTFVAVCGRMKSVPISRAGTNFRATH